MTKSKQPRFHIGDVITDKRTTIKIMAVDGFHNEYKYINWPDGSDWLTGYVPSIDESFTPDSDWLNSEIRRLLDLPDIFETMAKNIEARYPAGNGQGKWRKKG